MARRTNHGLLQKSSALNQDIRRALQSFSLLQLEELAAALEHIRREYDSLPATMGDLPEARLAHQVSRAISVLAVTCRWVQAILKAESDAGRFIAAGKTQARILLSELKSQTVGFSITRGALVSWLDGMCELDDPMHFERVLAEFRLIPLPVFYFVSEDPYAGIKRLREEISARGNNQSSDPGESTQQRAEPASRVIKVLFEVDGAPWATPQAVRSMVQYDVAARVQVLGWPRDMEWVEVDFLSTQDPQTYVVPKFRWSRAEVESSSAKKGGLLFKFAQSLQSEPIALATRARFLAANDARMLPATVIGHADLQIRALDQSSYPVLTRYPMIDIQIPKILEEVLRSLPELRPSDYDDFMNCLVVLGRYAGMVQQTGVFKGKDVDEKRDFQQHLLQHLRMQLGPDVREEETLAGGRLDLRFRNVVIELKVEHSIKDRIKLRTKYVRQPAQYSASGIPVSVVCILDMTEKLQPPSNVANNITLEAPALHGYDAATPDYPSRVAVIIIDGNLRSPSSYS